MNNNAEQKLSEAFSAQAISEEHQCIQIDFSKNPIEAGILKPLGRITTYSDSEEELAPHYKWVYNHTKIKNLRYSRLVQNKAANVKDVKPSKLKEDAEAIWKAGGENHKIAVLCVALKDKYNRIKKFVCTNQRDYKGKKGKNIIRKAHKRGYHVVQAQQSHAEGALLQFLQERPKTYKAIVGIGCDKKFCPDCVELLKRFLGEDYTSVCPENSASNSQSNNWYTPPALENVLGKGGVCKLNKEWRRG